MKILRILSENFPLRMHRISSDMESQARAKTLINLEEEGNEHDTAAKERPEAKEVVQEMVQDKEMGETWTWMFLRFYPIKTFKMKKKALGIP